METRESRLCGRIKGCFSERERAPALQAPPGKATQETCYLTNCQTCAGTRSNSFPAASSALRWSHACVMA